MEDKPKVLIEDTDQFMAYISALIETVIEMFPEKDREAKKKEIVTIADEKYSKIKNMRQ